MGLSAEVLHLYLNQANLTTSDNRRALVERMLDNAIIRSNTPSKGESGDKLAGQDGTQNEDEPAVQDGKQNPSPPKDGEVARNKLPSEDEPSYEDSDTTPTQPAQW